MPYNNHVLGDTKPLHTHAVHVPIATRMGTQNTYNIHDIRCWMLLFPHIGLCEPVCGVGVPRLPCLLQPLI